MSSRSAPEVSQRSTPPRDLAIAALAARQHGVIAAAQLRSSCGLTNAAIRRRVGSGRLHRVHRGVFSVGHLLLSSDGVLMAAVLASGRAALISHRSAAALWDLRPTGRSRIEVTVPVSRQPRARPGIELHQTRRLDKDDVDRVRGIPCTSVARTLLDLAEVLDRRALERACERAETLRLYDGAAIARAIARVPGRRGIRRLRAAIADAADGDTFTRSELEERFLALCRSARLPRPDVNAQLILEDAAVEADFSWRAERLVVETDGHATHGTRRAFENDRRRDQHLQLAGYRVVRFTWRQVADEPATVAETVRRLLDR